MEKLLTSAEESITPLRGARKDKEEIQDFPIQRGFSRRESGGGRITYFKNKWYWERSLFNSDVNFYLVGDIENFEGARYFFVWYIPGVISSVLAANYHQPVFFLSFFFFFIYLTFPTC